MNLTFKEYLAELHVELTPGDKAANRKKVDNLARKPPVAAAAANRQAVNADIKADAASGEAEDPEVKTNNALRQKLAISDQKLAKKREQEQKQV